MTRTWLLLRIESRRNPGLLFFPVLVATGWFVTMRFSLDGLSLWTYAGYEIQYTVIFLGPLTAGLAAWMAGRNRWRRMDELLGTTPFSPAGRDIVTWASAALWGIAAYLVVALAVVVVTYPGTTSGSPPWVAIAQVPPAILAYSAIGFVFGYYVRSRFTVPLVPIALYILPAVPTYIRGTVQNLTPVVNGAPNVFYDTNLEAALFLPLWLVGLTSVALAGVALRRERTSKSWLSLALSISLTAFAAWTLLESPVGRIRRDGADIEYEPVCEQGVLEVCVHPAYQAILGGVAPVLNRVAAPLQGISGVPTRAIQGIQQRQLPDGTMVYQVHSASQLSTPALAIARILVLGEGAYDYDALYEDRLDSRPAQAVIFEWLIQQAGIERFPSYTVQPSASLALERFTALDPVLQREWLASNYAALMAGELTLADIP